MPSKRKHSELSSPSGTTISGPMFHGSSPHEKMASSPTMANHVQSVNAIMLSTGQYSDLIITCKGKEFKVHRNIVLLQSKPLAAAINGGFRESFDGKIDLEDEEPDIVGLFLSFLYTSEYDGNRRKQPAANASSVVVAPKDLSEEDLIARLGTPVNIIPMRKRASESETPTAIRQKSKKEVDVSDHSNEIALLTNAQVYIMAEKYDVQPLKALAKIKYQELVISNWDSQSFITSLRLLFEGTPESDLLMQVAIRAAIKNVKKLVNREEFASLCKECGELGFEILKALVEDDNKENKRPYRELW